MYRDGGQGKECVSAYDVHALITVGARATPVTAERACPISKLCSLLSGLAGKRKERGLACSSTETKGQARPRTLHVNALGKGTRGFEGQENIRRTSLYILLTRRVAV